MNVKEGMRRLALVVGVVGAALGGFAAYAYLRDAIAARARYKSFELLATSDVVQQERTSWLLARLPPSYAPSSEITKDTTPGQAIEILRALPEGKQREALARLTLEAKKGILDELNKQRDIVSAWKSFGPERREELLGRMSPEQKSNLQAMIERLQQSEQDPYAAIAKPFSEVNKGRIKTIHWTKDLGVESIETEDGATLYPTPRPTLWPYLWAAIFPVLGFVIPWGSVRTLAWVGVGFFERSRV
jgi:MgtE-like protein